MRIHQEVIVHASPSAIYRLLTTSEEFARMSGGRAAQISTEVGGAVTMFGGDIQAVNVQLVQAKRVVQAWRSKAWPEGVYSIVKFELVPDGEGTMLVFDQAGHPEDAQMMLESGWQQMYWSPINALLSSA